MKSYIIRKIVLNPLASVVIAGLLGFIISHEIRENQTTSIDTANVIDLTPSTDTATVKPMGERELTDFDLAKSDQKFEEQTHESVRNFEPSLATLLSDKKFGLLRERLLKLASVAVTDDDKNRLGYILNLLGQIAIQEQDLYTAEVYLNEALDIFEDLNDDLGAAQIHMQLGRTHLKARQIARVAGTAYDELQVGRWYLANEVPDVAEQYIVRSIDKNLSINRYGSAASAYESLVKLYLREADDNLAQQAAFKSARLFSASGNTARARKVMDLLPENMKHSQQLAELDDDIKSNYSAYKKSILQIERARDYRRLYAYYRNVGDQARAWKFRLLANDSLAEVSKRALFHRQQGVLAILYNSNESMDLAENYFIQAQETFDFNGLDDLSAETRQLNGKVY